MMVGVEDNDRQLAVEVAEGLLQKLQERFTKNTHRHSDLAWAEVQARLEAQPDKLWSLYLMEQTGGEPDVVQQSHQPEQIIFYDCVVESPKGRRSTCYDQAALEARKANKPNNSAMAMATEMGITLLTEEQYRALQQVESFDLKTSSWVATPDPIRKLGGALFCDRRYDTVFTYHNGAESYYSARGFRGLLQI